MDLIPAQPCLTWDPIIMVWGSEWYAYDQQGRMVALAVSRKLPGGKRSWTVDLTPNEDNEPTPCGSYREARAIVEQAHRCQ